MKKLTKRYVVIFDNNNNVLIKLTDNTETYVGKDHKYAEFDSLQELEDFIEKEELKDEYTI